MDRDFSEDVRVLGAKAREVRDSLQSEEATKNSLVLPMIQALGYDVFDHNEVCPEYDADRGTKKGEKVDYAILENGEPIILIECKAASDSLHKSHYDTQLYRYFNATPTARFGILTNGVTYLFYTDLDKNNLMDEIPFLEIDLLDLRGSSIAELKKFCKPEFDSGQIISHAEDLKYSSLIREKILAELDDPSEDFIRCVLKGIYEGRLTQNAYEKFKPMVKRTFQNMADETVKRRLAAALETETEAQEEAQEEDEAARATKIVTTEEELEAYYIIRGILAEHVSASQVTYRDAESYFAIFFADNNRKPICRLQLDASTKYIFIPNENKEFTRYELESLEDIYSHKDQLIRMAKYWANS
ncbi:type I restriction endonuclease [Anaerotardibacter muris]|uniref:type I restriction endonuclease n=1 Tax=Anaerotardibacter muris TaxID=2941505 RepID=UPI00203C58C5|nr:type I restriction endonuclease [Anaerotardibacter muris]